MYVGHFAAAAVVVTLLPDAPVLPAAIGVASGAMKSEMERYVSRFGLQPTYEGKIASAFGDSGGGTQIEFPLPVTYLEKLGMLKEIR